MLRSRAVAAMCAVALLLLAGGCGGREPARAAGSGDGGAAVQSADDDSLAWEDDAPEDPDAGAAAGLGAAPTTAPPKPTSKPTRRTTPTKKSPPRKSTGEKLPPAPPKPAEGCTKPRYEGAQASRADAKAALVDAAGRTYWPTSAPSLRVPLDLVKATAYQESGWQSNIIACDGGVGLMQVMKDTAAFVNQRFDQTYDIRNYRDNAALGANYLAWLIKYFGDVYFDGDYDADPADCASHDDLCLLNAVIAAYNFGPGAVDTDAGLKIPNPRYVDNVRSLMTTCECLNW
ncbi:lytic transglycosylase domain-containing protein [Asanoa sp. WMMD1127]|uniref:lytic transglycosylase domain-containing protein n=1 Tax=Asanoa sp. WMMD1127 TaxID=3016107 RepID=UPI002415D115|nr:lytic transglycosylase domain-containing protein [Asanoa sp. WMMD1127]MDG4826950.1 lytic transglycosylase domain-containing protein [Asanoa sp. WMMD1127]